METQFVLTQNGQEIEQSDLALIATAAAHADDHVLAELLRLPPYQNTGAPVVARGVLPFGHDGTKTPMIAPNGATGSVLVLPFRAVIGSRVDASVDAKRNWKDDVRSAVWLGGATSLTAPVTLAANVSGQPRWDLVYAAVTVDAASSTITRYLKDALTGTPIALTIAKESNTSVTVGVQPGSPSAPPTVPATPADSGSTYYIPLAYVVVPAGFGAGSTVQAGQIAIVAPVLGLARSTQVSTTRPANASSRFGGPMLTPAAQAAWAAAASRASGAPAFLPSTMGGAQGLLVAIDLLSAPKSHASGDVIDDSIDWRNRVFFVTVAANMSGGFPWNGVAANPIPQPIASPNTLDSTKQMQMGQSFWDDTSTVIGGSIGGCVMHLEPTNMAVMTGGSKAVLYVDATTGALRVAYSGNPGIKLFAWIEATAPYDNP